MNDVLNYSLLLNIRISYTYRDENAKVLNVLRKQIETFCIYPST